MPVIPPQPWSELVGSMQTGDLILFSGSSRESEWIKLLTGGAFSHASMLVRITGVSEPWLWQEAPEALSPDPRTSASTTGAQLGDAEAATRAVMAFGDVPFYVPLTWQRPAGLDEQILDIIDKWAGLPFGTVLQMALDYAIGHLYNQATGQTSMYCAELVATTYQELGVLSTTAHPPNWYSPNSFATTTDLPWSSGATLGEPVQITLDGVQALEISTGASGWPAPLAPPVLPPPPALH